MRIAIAVAMVLALAACSRPAGQFLAGDAGPVTTTTEGSPGTASVAEDTTTETAVAAKTVGAQVASKTTVVTSLAVTPTTLAPAQQATTTPTTVASLTVDPQGVESALAELDELLSSLGSAMSAMEQAFEQGE